MSEHRFDRLEEKLDGVTEKIHSIDNTLAAQHESLKEHIRRTRLLEDSIEPVKKHVAMVEGVLKFIGGASVMAAIVQLFRLFT